MKKEENKHIENNDDQEPIEELNSESQDNMDFIHDFIERKKLQNRVLREIIDNIKTSDKE
ncbi:MAG: hypothetical protein WCK09_04080 [Bacteroidota bacterium]